MVARYITGIGTGIEVSRSRTFMVRNSANFIFQTSSVPMYQSELCEAKYRGRLVSSEPLFVGGSFMLPAIHV